MPAAAPIIPKPVTFIMISMVGLSLAAAMAGRWNPAPPAPPGPVSATRELRFEDGADGSVIVRLAEDNRTIEVLRGEQGFLRGTLRGLARTRKAEGIGAEAPFRLTAWTSGRLTLEDPATTRSVDLTVFGAMNATVFARLLTAEGPL